MTLIETTAADFCNSSIIEDTARLTEVIKNGTALDMESMIETLIKEAMDSLQAIVINAPDEPNTLECADFTAYYKAMALEIVQAAEAN
jgi:hypothetical protein